MSAPIPTSWKTIRDTLKRVITDAAVTQITSAGGVFRPLETPEWEAEWKDRRRTFIHPLQNLAVYMKMKNAIGVGWDENQFLMLDTGLAIGAAATGQFDMFEVSSGMRRFTLTLEAWTLQEDDELNSFELIERIRDNLDFNSARQAFLDANLDYTDNSQSRDMQTKFGGRWFSITAIDLTFHACIITTDTTPVGYFERIILTSHEQAGGVDEPASLRMINETLPPE